MAGEARVGSLVVTEDDRTFQHTFEGRGDFTIMVPLPYEEIYILGTISRIHTGGSVEALTLTEREYERMVCTLNTIIRKGPTGWTTADQCPDPFLLQELWRWYQECVEEFHGKLKKNQFVKPPVGATRKVAEGGQSPVLGRGTGGGLKRPE